MKEQEKTSHLKRGYSIRWIFNSLMITGVIFGWLISAAVENIGEARRHQGPGTVWYEAPDRDEIVSEAEYKRDRYATGGGLLIIGLVLWISIAYDAKKKEAMRTAKQDAAERTASEFYLEAKVEANAVYKAVFAKVMGAAAYQAVVTEAMKDPAYQEAEKIEMAKLVAYYKASGIV